MSSGGTLKSWVAELFTLALVLGFWLILSTEEFVVNAGPGMLPLTHIV